MERYIQSRHVTYKSVYIMIDVSYLPHGKTWILTDSKFVLQFFPGDIPIINTTTWRLRKHYYKLKKLKTGNGRNDFLICTNYKLDFSSKFSFPHMPLIL